MIISYHLQNARISLSIWTLSGARGRRLGPCVGALGRLILLYVALDRVWLPLCSDALLTIYLSHACCLLPLVYVYHCFPRLLHVHAFALALLFRMHRPRLIFPVFYSAAVLGESLINAGEVRVLHLHLLAVNVHHHSFLPRPHHIELSISADHERFR